MLTYAQIRASRPTLWSGSGDEWTSLAQSAWAASDDLNNDVHAQLTTGWVSDAGVRAADSVQQLIDRLRVASFECRASGMVCKGMGHALQIAQDTLDAAERMAIAEGMLIDDAGVLHEPTDPTFHHDLDWQQSAHQTEGAVAFLLAAAMTGAGNAEQTAARLLARFAANGGLTDVDAAENDMGDASRAEVDMLTGMVPQSGDQRQMAAWWAALSAEDQQTLTLAVPEQLQGRPGIPQDAFHTGRYDGTKVAAWAQAHWNDTSDDPFKDNCTNFVSDALAGGGVPQKDDFWLGTLSENSWDKGAQTGIHGLDEVDYTHSRTWAQAQDSYDFWKKHGQEVSPQDARPGDIIYWEQDSLGAGNAPGTVHHAAVITSVVDGDIRYTQHSGQQISASIDGREPEFIEENGQQNIHIIRPDPDW